MKKFTVFRILEVAFGLPLAALWLAAVILASLALAGGATMDWRLPYVFLVIGGILTIAFLLFTLAVDIVRWEARLKTTAKIKGALGDAALGKALKKRASRSAEKQG